METSSCNSFPILAQQPASDSLGRPGSHGAVRNLAGSRLIVKLLRWINSPSYITVRNSASDLKHFSRYDTDEYGRPRVLSRLEVILHALGWPIVLGVIAGFSVAILSHQPLAASREKLTHSQVVYWEKNS